MYKDAKDCKEMADVRLAIDSLDEQIVDLLGKRLTYIHKAADIKQSEDLIRDDERIESMLAVREQMAIKNDYDPEFIRHLFAQIIEYSVNKELNVWRNKS